MAPMGKVAVVVGVGSGLGGAVARRFAKGGFKVALVARRAPSATQTYEDIKADGGTSEIILADAGKEADVKKAYKEIVDKFQASPEVLVFNAKGGEFKWPPPSILDTSPKEFHESFGGGTTGALLWMQQVIPEQLKAGRGTILLTGATAGMRGGAGFALLSPYKFALRSLGQCAAREFQPKGIHVAHIIVDGRIKTGPLPDGENENNYLLPEHMAEQYYQLYAQHPSAWTHELDLRPFTEKF